MVNNAEKRFNISTKQVLSHFDTIHNMIHLLVRKIGRQSHSSLSLLAQADYKFFSDGHYETILEIKAKI